MLGFFSPQNRTRWRQCFLWSGPYGAEGQFLFGLNLDQRQIKIKRSILVNKQPRRDPGGCGITTDTACRTHTFFSCQKWALYTLPSSPFMHSLCTRSPFNKHAGSKIYGCLCVCVCIRASLRLLEYLCGGLKSKQLLNRLWLIQPWRS